MGWDFDLNSNSDSKKAEFTKFPVGITRIRILDKVPHVRWSHFLPKFSRSLNCPGRDCPICEIRRQQKINKEPYSYAMSRRFALNVFNYETNRVEIMEQGVTFFEDIRDLKNDIEEDGGKLSDAIFKVRRRGTGKDDTSYRLDIDEIKPLSEEELEKYQEDIIDLEEYFAPNTTEQILRIVNGESWEEVMMSGDSEVEEEIEIE